MRERTRKTFHLLKQGAVAGGKRVQTTLGELVVAAYDTVGNEVKDVAKLLASPELGRASKSRIVLVQ